MILEEITLNCDNVTDVFTYVSKNFDGKTVFLISAVAAKELQKSNRVDYYAIHDWTDYHCDDEYNYRLVEGKHDGSWMQKLSLKSIARFRLEWRFINYYEIVHFEGLGIVDWAVKRTKLERIIVFKHANE